MPVGELNSRPQEMPGVPGESPPPRHTLNFLPWPCRSATGSKQTSSPPKARGARLRARFSKGARSRVSFAFRANQGSALGVNEGRPKPLSALVPARRQTARAVRIRRLPPTTPPEPRLNRTRLPAAPINAV
ncbi:hypothetical protein SKAU_G00179980 [Synaphobranchus kaupii]|uniref:Uncharacterized protein n=1 Tax=Synaphobranchus kaupii TaxID=118154 RepID=A0A9Q1J180_SYNKA|nr:hypothetical protein SKAU_G00179980 [Synaphobranchus kaupii]